MKRASVLCFACTAIMLWAGTALAAPTSQQVCSKARITAWKVYTSCIDKVVAKAATAASSVDAQSAAFAKCRNRYFKRWTAFQTKASLAGSTCVGSRYTDNGDHTVTDNLSGLTWEKKDNAGGIHDKDNTYTWSAGPPNKENGTVFATFLSTVNAGGGFGGANGWRLPTLSELQTTMLDFPCSGVYAGLGCTCPSTPCVDPALDAANTTSNPYWSATTYDSSPSAAWIVYFFNGYVYATSKPFGSNVRAVRGGL
jgi:hypothetical protein